MLQNDKFGMREIGSVVLECEIIQVNGCIFPESEG